MKMAKFFAVGAVTLCASFCVQASQTYTLQYAANSPIKSVPLRNATLVLEIYDYDKPDGFKRIKTNTKKSFTLNYGEDFEVVGIVGERKKNARCSGYATPENKKIIIRCDKY
ncbi:MAG: hypothetical protein AB7V32_03830 [Candidatus Berkiella sp.]